MKQKDIFLQSEGDAWFDRNRQAIAKRDFEHNDSIVAAILEIIANTSDNCESLHILEVGCGSGERLAWLSELLRCNVYGVDPSEKAVSQACMSRVTAQKGTAEELPFASSSFDILIFGFCLYLCDRQDLFRIAMEADRVLKPNAWLVIHDFFAQQPIKNEYYHKHGVYSYKMDYRSLFTGHPYYTCYSHRLDHHQKRQFTDDLHEWVATSVLRKKALHD